MKQYPGKKDDHGNGSNPEKSHAMENLCGKAEKFFHNKHEQSGVRQVDPSEKPPASGKWCSASSKRAMQTRRPLPSEDESNVLGRASQPGAKIRPQKSVSVLEKMQCMIMRGPSKNWVVASKPVGSSKVPHGMRRTVSVAERGTPCLINTALVSGLSHLSGQSGPSGKPRNCVIADGHERALPSVMREPEQPGDRRAHFQPVVRASLQNQVSPSACSTAPSQHRLD